MQNDFYIRVARYDISKGSPLNPEEVPDINLSEDDVRLIKSAVVEMAADRSYSTILATYRLAAAFSWLNNMAKASEDPQKPAFP